MNTWRTRPTLRQLPHYHLEHDRLMKHWRALFGDSIFTLDYDALVKTPEPVMRKLVDFLGLPWDDRCLDFRNADMMVKTASVWQVREGLYEFSSGRWQNYASLVENIRPLFDKTG
ncbi:MAG: sulfotransferase [Woeseiaceae bacterium]|nr:sulfotransferase [Woeseiaceae bacterium]